jgi:trigger factor
MIAEARRFPGQEKQVIEYYQKTPEALNQLRAPIYEDKVIDFILELAQVSERHTTPEQFRNEGEAA